MIFIRAIMLREALALYVYLVISSLLPLSHGIRIPLDCRLSGRKLLSHQPTVPPFICLCISHSVYSTQTKRKGFVDLYCMYRHEVSL